MATILKNLSEYDFSKVPSASGMRFGIVVSEWNTPITMALCKGAIETLLLHGAKEENIHISYVPGSFELSLGAQLIAEKKDIDAVIAVGCVIQGETRHFDFICQGVAYGITEVSLKYNKPVIFGVLTPNSQQQALDRAGGKHGNKGVEAAVTAIKMANVRRMSN
jgi:6,7-dimethyl-8-ribityllumazine synthase